MSLPLAPQAARLALALLLLTLPVGATAQVEPEAAAPAAADAPAEQTVAPEGIDSLQILGERIDAADVQDEAQAISAFDLEELDRASITNVDGLAFNVPSLHVGQQGNQAIVTLRGIGTENASITGEPGVQFHVDGVNYARPAAARVAFFDLEAVQVHRGPHGLTGGKNATGGAIHVITRKPHDELEMNADFEWGAYDMRRYRAAVNIPIVPELLATRLSFLQEDRTGYQINLTEPSKSNRADDADNLGLRGQLSYRPTDALDVLLQYNYYRATGVGPGAKLIGKATEKRCLEDLRPFFTDPNFLTILGQPPNQTILFRDGTRRPRAFSRTGITRHTQTAFCADINAQRIETQPTEDPADARKVYLDQIQQQDNQIWGWAGTLTWELPELPLLGLTQLTSVTGFENTSLSDPRDFDTIDIPFFSLTTVDNDSYQYSSELKLESADADALSWLTGLFYQRESSELLINGSVFGGGEDLGLKIDQRNTVKSYGWYAETQWRPRDDLTFGIGARFSRDFKSNRLLRLNGALTSTSTGLDAVGICLGRAERNALLGSLAEGMLITDAVPTCEDSWRRWTGGLSVEWRPADDHLLYAQIDSGYKAGGYIVADTGKFDPETVRAYTVGSKSRLLDSRLTLNLEAFYYDYRDYQVVEIDGLSIRTENAPEARVYGVELEFDAEPLPGLRLNGQVGYLDAEFREFRSVDPLDSLAGRARQDALPLSEFEDLSGNRLARAPEWSYTIAAEYSLPLGDLGTLTPRVQFYWQDDTFYRAYNGCSERVLSQGVCTDPDLDLQQAYHRTDLRLTWRGPEEVWSFEAFVLNLEDDDIFQNLLIGSRAVGSPGLAQYSPPRIYGFRVGFRY